MSKNTQLRGMIRSSSGDSSNLYKQYSRWSLLALDFISACIRMDPQERPTAEELLKHNYFHHDKFPHKFLPALREKVLSEYNSNPLLRRYKADVLISSDRKDLRRASHLEQPPKWKINLVDSHMKRKFSCETVNISEVNSFSLPRNSNQRLTVKKEEELKKSPSVLQSISKNSNSNHQGSLPRNFIKRIEHESETIITPLWLGGGNHKKKEFVKIRHDDFCLPNVPGGKKKILYAFFAQ